MNIEEKAEKLILVLTKESYSGVVEWDVTEAPTSLTKGTDGIYPLFLETKFKGTDIGLFQVRSRYYHDETEFSWTEEVGMCLLGRNREVIWNYTSGRSGALSNLFEVARVQASGIDDLLDKLLE